MLSDNQREIMRIFYSVQPTKVPYNKKHRGYLWEIVKKHNESVIKEIDFEELAQKCPALKHQIKKSYTSCSNIQSAVFSECVYAQTLANMFNLEDFAIYGEELSLSMLPEEVSDELSLQHITPRYMYADSSRTKFLIQAGGRGGVDCMYIDLLCGRVALIEFKEPNAKTGEYDLPRYGENGRLVDTKKFLNDHEHFSKMLQEQQDLNFFDMIGKNVHNFTMESINAAVTGSYGDAGKYADVICTEDKDGYLVMIPANQIIKWADAAGEIRPAGRNHTAVWTPDALEKFLLRKDAKIEDGIVTIRRTKLDSKAERGGNGEPSRNRINSIFFVYVKHCIEKGDKILFELQNVRQLRPTISAKVSFKKITHKQVKACYIENHKR